MSLLGLAGDQPPGPGSLTPERLAGGGTVTATPIELGATDLISSDRILHASKEVIGALIIEPPIHVYRSGTRHLSVQVVEEVLIASVGYLPEPARRVSSGVSPGAAASTLPSLGVDTDKKQA